jgi:hypothetical protein
MLIFGGREVKFACIRKLSTAGNSLTFNIKILHLFRIPSEEYRQQRINMIL